MASLINKKITFQGGEALPQVGSEAYIQAQQNLSPTGSYNAPINTTIDATTIGNVQPPKLSPPVTSTGAAGFGAELTSKSNQDVTDFDSLQARVDTQAKEKESLLTKSSKRLSELLGIQKGSSSVTDEAYSATNEQGTSVDTTGKKLKDVNAKINAIDIRTQEEIKGIESAGGNTLGQSANQIRAIQRRSATDKADLYIEKLMAQGDYDSAKSIADRKVDVFLEEQKLNLDKAKFDYDNNKDLYTKAEQRQFELNYEQAKRDLEKKDTDLKTVESLALDALQNGAPTSVVTRMRTSGDINDAISIGGQYVNKIARDEAKVKQLLDNNKLLAEDTTVTSNPLVNAMVNVNAGSAEGQQKRDAERVAQFVANGQTKEAKNLVLSRVTSKMSGTERDAELDRRNTIDALTEMQTALNDYVATTGDTNIIKGGIENVANKIGTTSDPRLASIKARIVQATQKYRNSITGAAWGDQETAEYKAIFPSITNTNKLNQTIIDTMLPLLKNNERNAIGLYLGGSDVYDSIFGAQITVGPDKVEYEIID